MPRDIEIVTVVGVFDPISDVSFDVNTRNMRNIEAAIDETAQGGDAMTERGPAKIVIVPRRQTEILIESERIEVRQRYPGESMADAGTRMARLFSAVLDSLTVNTGELQWLRTGYNYILTVPTEKTAKETIAEGTFSKEFENKLKYPIQGAGAWIWLELANAVLWLRLEPHRGDPATSRISVNANFLEENRSASPAEEMQINLTTYLTDLNELLDRVGI